jgi:hypothetical protein
VELVGDEEEGCGGGEVPAVVGVGDEDECAVPDCKEELPTLTLDERKDKCRGVWGFDINERSKRTSSTMSL